MGTFFFGIGCSFVSCASHLRCRKADVESIARAGMKVVVCLLNDAEMRTLGMNGYMYCMKECGISAFADVWAISAAACDAFSCVLVVIQHPIVEGGPPSSIEAFEPVVERVAALLVSGDSVLCHCRGGVGRAGLLASCVLLGTGVSNSPCEAITLVRKRRHVKFLIYFFGIRLCYSRAHP